jgi:hypothetical protein
VPRQQVLFKGRKVKVRKEASLPNIPFIPLFQSMDCL